MLKNKVAEKEQDIGMLHARLLRKRNSTQRSREEEFSFEQLEIKVLYWDHFKFTYLFYCEEK